MHSDPTVGLSCLGRSLGRPGAYALRQPSWLAGPFKSRSASDQKQDCFSEGAGLPAMRAPRCIRHTQSIPSQASQLPHLDPVRSHLMHSDLNVGRGCLGRSLGRPVAYALRQPSWLAGPVRSRSASDQQQVCFCVGAGLPAMRAPRCIRHTQSIPSQASQLPHLDPVHSHLMHSDPNVGLGCLGRSLGRPGAYALRQPSWLAGPVKSRSASDQQQICFSVGAGLPAMRAPRCIRHTQSIPSQASQLPHLDPVHSLP